MTKSIFKYDTNAYYIKENVDIDEYEIHKYVYNLKIVNIPKIIRYNKKTKTFIIRKLPKDNLADAYGECASNIPTNVFDKIRTIIKSLYENNIEYLDITGYNFIEYRNKIWIIDFEHCVYNVDKSKTPQYLIDFMNGLNKWNLEFL